MCCQNKVGGNMKKIIIICITVISIIVLFISIECCFVSSVKRTIIEIYESNGNYHSEHILDDVVKILNPRNRIEHPIIAEKEDFQITDFTTTLNFKTMDYTYEYKVYSKEKGKEKILYNDSRKICLHIDFQGFNWVIVSAKEIF